VTVPSPAGITPPDAAAALRSFPRRLREAARAATTDLAGVPEPDELDEMAARIGPDGRSALDVIAATARSIAALDRAVHQALVLDDAVINADLLHPPSREFDAPRSGELETEVALLEHELLALADRVDTAPSTRWLRPARLTGGGSTTALALLGEAVRTAHGAIADVERTLRAVRGRG